ncbi:hypothetical protein C2G38_2128707 [Gigaspora rosea]|uniref:Uncharacterized protein n=1 Tax=Gigaspora rosea TaxID=44941 RepID=A0A397TS36_9GLOM|nr:hypothetical protein C2G38_2128707 [Gigaspora rosea]
MKNNNFFNGSCMDYLWCQLTRLCICFWWCQLLSNYYFSIYCKVCFLWYKSLSNYYFSIYFLT